MLLLPRKGILAIAAVLDIAMNSRGKPVAAKSLASRHRLPPRHLEPVLQALVRQGILRGVRGPRGGYELARERRRITAGDVVRAALTAAVDEAQPPGPESRLVDEVVAPVVKAAGEAFLRELDSVTIDDLCRAAEQHAVFGGTAPTTDFTI
jgi:Rrf2 family iron-sulfur cluster assembly transcriptional regulator